MSTDDLETKEAEALRRVIVVLVKKVLKDELAAMQAAPPELMTVSEAARFLRCSNRTVLRKVHGGKLPAEGAGRFIRIRRSDVERLLSGPRRRPKATTPEQLAELEEGLR